MKQLNKLIMAVTATSMVAACTPGPIYIGSHPTAVTTPSGKVEYVSYKVDKKRQVVVPKSTGSALIVNKINAAYAADPKLNPYKINVSYHDGLVTLMGTVPDQATKNYAIKVARYTKGVFAVEAKNLVVSSKINSN